MNAAMGTAIRADTAGRREGRPVRWFAPLLLLIVLAALLAACDSKVLERAAEAKPVSWIDAPLDDSHLPVAPYEVIFHGSDPVGVAKIEFSVDGEVQLTSANPDAERHLVTGRHMWEPPAAGNYTLRVRTQSVAGPWGEYAVAVVTVGEPPATAIPVPTEPTAPVPTATWTPTPLPTATATPIPTTIAPTPVPPTVAPTVIPTVPTPAPTPKGPVISEPEISTEQFYCPDDDRDPKEVTIVVTASDPDGVDIVRIVFRLKDKASDGRTPWAERTMAPVNDEKTLWVVTIPSALFEELGWPWYDESWFRFYFVAYDENENETQSDTYRDSITLVSICD